MGHDKTNRGRRSAARAGLGIGLVALWLFAFAPSALAAPSHPPIPSLDITGLNRACGVATDSKGDLYASSAGDGEVKVFNEAHTEIGSIANSNEPCGLAVDTNGNLYVSEQGTGEVVRYEPNAYPLTATPSYGAPTTIDASGEAKGIAVDPTDNRVYVAEGDHVQVYQSDGTSGQNEIQRIQIFSSVTGGTFELAFEGQETSPIPYNAAAAEVEAALESLSTIGSGDVSVTFETSSSGLRRYFVTFEGPLASEDVPSLLLNGAGLTPANAGEISTTTPGFAFDGRIAEGELEDATGVATYTYGTDQFSTTHYLYVADAGSPDSIQILSTQGDVRSFKPRRTIEEAGGQPLEFGPAGSAVAADPSNGHFYLYDAGHHALDEFEASGQLLDQTTSGAPEDAEPAAIAVFPSQDEVQLLTLEATGGSFALEFEGESTAAIPVRSLTGKPKAAEVRAALEALAAIGPGNVAVQGRYGGSPTSYAIAFTGTLGGANVPQLIPNSGSLTGSTHTASLATATQGSGPGRLYLGSGAGAGAKLLAFGPLSRPGRAPLPSLSQKLEGIHAAAAVDSYGDVYVANSAFIEVFGPGGEGIEVGPEGRGIPAEHISDLEVDSQGNVYGLDQGATGEESSVKMFEPASYPPVDGTQYAGPSAVLTEAMLEQGIEGMGMNPENDHLFVTGPSHTIELASAAEGSTILAENFAGGFGIERRDVAVCAATGDVYFGGLGKFAVVNEEGTEKLAQPTGAGSPGDTLNFVSERIAVDQSDCHVLFAYAYRGHADEIEPSGAFVAGFDPLTEEFGWGGIAVDNGVHSPNRGDVYVAYDDPKVETQLTAYGPLSYGEAPVVASGTANGLGGGEATLNGSVDPRGFDLEECAFEWGLDGQPYEHLDPCAESPAQIGHGSGAVAVHAEVTLPDPEARYRYRLVARNRFGEGAGEGFLFGPPKVAARSALPILYDEATLRAQVDPAGLLTSYRFEYVTEAEYEAEGFTSAQTTPAVELPAGEEAVAVETPVTGLAEGTTYRFRVLAESEDGTSTGETLGFATLQRQPAQECANAEYRTGLSAKLPDCRAYELVTPAQTAGTPLDAPYVGDISRGFNGWLTPPRGDGAGEALGFGTSSTLPGFDAVGLSETYRATRAAGGHPAAGWSTELISSTFTEANSGTDRGGSPGRLYSFWEASWTPGSEGTLVPGEYLRTPAGFEPTGEGDLGIDLGAKSRFVSDGGTHVVFTSKERLEAEVGDEAAPRGTEAVYDRAAGSSHAEVVSTKPDGSPFGAGEDAQYVSASEDGGTIIFRVGGTLYRRRGGETVAIATGSPAFAGVSENGGRVFYAAGSGNKEAPLRFCAPAAGACVGEGEAGLSQLAAAGVFVAVSADGTHVLFFSKEALTPEGEENEAGQHATEGEPNLYLWDGAAPRFVAVLDAADTLNRWTEGLAATGGLGNQPARAVPDGSAFAFQSHARLTAYENEGHDEIYRYDPSAPEGRRLLCVSCDPSGAPPGGDATFEITGEGSVVESKNLISNITDDARRVVFESGDRLMPEDANAVRDVYEWRADGVSGCLRGDGCLALISSGQGDTPSRLYSMSADGHDIFFHTLEKLAPADVPDTASIYDARIDGGIPAASEAAPCQGDACQGQGSPAPVLPSPQTGGSGGGNVAAAPVLRCARDKHQVKGRCVARHRKKRHHRKHHRKHHRAHHNRRSHR